MWLNVNGWTLLFIDLIAFFLNTMEIAFACHQNRVVTLNTSHFNYLAST